eukprot:379388_1
MAAILFFLMIVLNHVHSNDETFQSKPFYDNLVLYPKCINRTHDNAYTQNVDFANQSYAWYSTGICAVWRASASMVTVKLSMFLAGFTSSGIGGGTLAASIQSYLGNVGAGSLFSYLQSLGAVGGVNMFGPAGMITFVAWSVVCSDSIDISVNFMNENATQCFMNEKIVYQSLEWLEEMSDKTEDIMEGAKKMEQKYKIKEKITEEATNKLDDVLLWMSDKTEDIMEGAKKMEQKYKIKEKITEEATNTFEYAKNKLNKLRMSGSIADLLG